MITKRNRLGWRLLTVAMCALVTAGCFGGGNGSESATKTDYTGMDKNPGDPVKGGTLVLTTAADAKSLDVHKQSSYTTHGVVGAVYGKLVDYKFGPDIPRAIKDLEGDLAEKWEHSEDGLTWTFHLRQGVKFQNVAPVNGREFKSSDVKCTIDRIQAEGFQRYLLNVVDTVDYPDDYTVVFNLKSPYAAFDHNMANHYMEIVPCEGTSGQYDMNTTAIGTGPFILQTWNRDTESIYVKHPEFYEGDTPHLDGVRRVVMSDLNAQMAAFRAGQIDYLTSGSADKRQIQQLAGQIEGSIVMTQQSITQYQVYMNMEKPPFDNLKVRQAVSLAMDREGMMEAMRPTGQMSGPISSGLDGALSPEKAKELQPYDPDKAKELLKEAGYPDGFETTLMVTPGYGETTVQEAQWVQEDLAKVGIKATLDVQEYATYFTDSWPNKKYAMGYGPQTPMMSVDEYLSAVYPADGSRNWYGFNDPELEKMIEDQRVILDKQERAKKLEEIQIYIIENIANPAVAYLIGDQIMFSPRVRNYWSVPEYTTRYWKDVWVADGK